MVMPSSAGLVQSSASIAICSSLRWKYGSSKPMAFASRRNSSVLGTASPSGAIAWLVERQIEMPPGEHDLVLLHLRGGGQHDVGVARGVGDEMLAHHREQIFARQARSIFSCSGATTIGLAL